MGRACKYCGRDVYGKEFCPSCGNYTVTSGEKSLSIVIMILSSINLFFGVPFIATFGGLWFLFGAFANDEVMYIGLLLSCLVYMIMSGVSFIVCIVDTIKKNRYSKLSLIIFIIAVLSLVISFFLFTMI